MANKTFKIIFLSIWLAVFFSTLQAQILKPVKWKFEASRKTSNVFELTFTANIDQNWHLYSQFIPEGGPIPTRFEFETDSNGVFQKIGKTEELSKIEEEFDQSFQMQLKYFSHKAVFKQKIKVLKETELKGYVEFMTCDNEKCLPPEQIEFSFKLSPSVEQTASPTISSSQKADSATLTVTSTQDSVSVAQTEKAADPEPSTEEQDDSLFLFFWLAFGGGLISILMPCVFPMIPMTVSFFMHSSKSKTQAKAQALFFSLSIIFIYAAIGLIVSATLGPDFINWLSTSWGPNLFFFLIFLIFAASFFGLFEITLPSGLINKSDKQADRGGYIGAFFMAFTLVLVSFSCTVPIVGAVLVEAARGAVIKPIIGMLGFSLAFALPFGFFAFFPSKLNNLPKSGGWLNSVKVVLGFLELALSLKFLMVADQTYHWGLLSRDLYIALWITIFTLMGFYLLGKLRFEADTEIKHLSVPRLVFAILTFTFVVYLIPGMFGAPLKALSGYLPPQTDHSFNLTSIIRENSKNSAALGETNNLCEKPMYADFLHLPHGLEGYFEYNQAIQCAREQHKPLFIDFTGHGCVNCREMEQRVWADPRVLKMLSNDFIVVALYVDDKTKLPESEWKPSVYDGKLMKTIGKVNSDIQITGYNTNSQPNYVLLGLDEKMLAPMKAHDLNADNFVSFLENGLLEFNKRFPK